MDNYSWDIVYACSGNYINKQLINNANKLIQSFEYEDAAVKIIGHFGAWKIVPGGGGSLLQFETPITTGEVAFKQFNKTIPLDGVIPLVEMQLQLVKGGTQQIVRSLVFNCTTVGKHKGDTASGAVTIINPDTSGTLAKYIDTHPDEAKLGAAMLSHGLGMIFVQNVDELNFVFASLLPVITSQNGGWISPAKVTYAYQQPIDGSLGGIAIMGMLENVSTDNLPRNFDPALLLNKDFGFVLSSMAFMKNVILPSLPGGFQGNCHINDFNLNNDGSITLKERFTLNSVKVGLIYYTPSVTEINYHIDDTTIRCYVATQTDITGLTSAYVINTVTSNNPSEFNVATRILGSVAISRSQLLFSLFSPRLLSMSLTRKAFRRLHYPVDVIVQCVRWYLSYSLSLRNLEEMMAERGITVDHSTVYRWVIRLTPLPDKAFRRYKRPVGRLWRMDETYIRVKGQWKYLYRAVDSSGQTVDFLLTASRDAAAALRLFRKAFRRNGAPEVVTIDNSTASKSALTTLSTDRAEEETFTIRQNRYLNNLVEQDHRNIKRRIKLMAGFKSFRRAQSILAGIELIHMLRKGQYQHPRGDGMSPAEPFYLSAA